MPYMSCIRLIIFSLMVFILHMLAYGFILQLFFATYDEMYWSHYCMINHLYLIDQNH